LRLAHFFFLAFDSLDFFEQNVCLRDVSYASGKI
jgi:hypothetical protein